MRRALLSLALFAALGGSARADVIHFANGRTVEGRVVERSATTLTIEVGGGQLTLPVDQVARVEARRAPQDDLADRTRKTDMGDPDAVTRLAEWAASRGLGDTARQLEAHAEGVRLERQVEAARASNTAGAWLDVLAWAEAKGHGKVVLVWLVQQALKVDPQDPEALETNLRLARLDETPRAEPPSLPPPPTPRRAPPPPPRGGSETAADRERIAQLEAELASQEAEADELRNRVNRLENQRRGVRRRRQPTNPPIQPGLFLVPAPQPPAPPPPPPPPAGIPPR
jgi:hypothetical protein